MPALCALYRYPVKSTRGEAMAEAKLAATGLPFDRHWMVADATGRTITGRTDPRLVLVRAQVIAETLALSAPSMTSLSIPLTAFQQAQTASVWEDDFPAKTGSRAADDWLSTYLGRPVQLLYVGTQPHRRLRGRPDIPLGFADSHPLLLMGEGSLAELNRRARQDFTMARFRPNLVIAGAEPFAEDHWRHICIGEVTFSLMKPCDRCAFTMVDPETGRKATDQEPMRTLATFRKSPEGVLFGQYAVAENPGTLKVGMPVEILAELSRK